MYDSVLLEDKKADLLREIAKTKLGGDHKSEEFQKSNDKKSCQLINQTEQNRIDRQNKTDYKIADAAGVSHDTILRSTSSKLRKRQRKE